VSFNFIFNNFPHLSLLFYLEKANNYSENVIKMVFKSIIKLNNTQKRKRTFYKSTFSAATDCKFRGNFCRDSSVEGQANSIFTEVRIMSPRIVSAEQRCSFTGSEVTGHILRVTIQADRTTFVMLCTFRLNEVNRNLLGFICKYFRPKLPRKLYATRLAALFWKS